MLRLVFTHQFETVQPTHPSWSSAVRPQPHSSEDSHRRSLGIPSGFHPAWRLPDSQTVQQRDGHEDGYNLFTIECGPHASEDMATIANSPSFGGHRDQVLDRTFRGEQWAVMLEDHPRTA